MKSWRTRRRSTPPGTAERTPPRTTEPEPTDASRIMFGLEQVQSFEGMKEEQLAVAWSRTERL